MQQSSTPAPAATKYNAAHPVCALGPEELSYASELIRALWPEHTDIRFKTITLDEPPKALLLPYFQAEREGRSLPHIDRKAFTSYYIRNTDRFHEAIINLSTGKVENNVRLGANIHGNGDYEEILLIEKNALEDEGVKAEIAKLRLPEGSVICADPWIYGSDGINDDERYYQVFLYMRDPCNASEVDSCHYAFPLPISPVLECNTYKVIRIDLLPTGKDNTIKPTSAWKPVPPNEYISEHQDLRKDLKPLHVVQPEGASFTVKAIGNNTMQTISWQKWQFHLHYNAREGPVLFNVQYDGRPLFYRVSLSDMNIPYADPRQPFLRKSAFDLGDVGAGVCANNLALGCDCLGNIQYISSTIADDKGTSVPVENCVCIHEQDGGIGWKHTNYRTGRAAVTRNRELVLQTIITVSNYEYILAYIFNQVGELTYEVRATGVLSTQPIDHELCGEDGEGVPWGTVVHPGVLATHHQHVFSLRIDPNIGSFTEGNQLVYSEAHPMPINELNPHGTGYTATDTLVTHSSGLDLAPDANRTFKIVNPNQKNKINGKQIGYKIMAPPFQKILSAPDSFNYKRAEFSSNNIYVTRYADRELYAGGWYTNQSRGGTGVRSWADRKDDVAGGKHGEDLVVFVQFGINHIPRIEDFPVMPCEKISVHLKPVNFFDKNPGLDVPPSEQAFNKSTRAEEVVHQQGGSVEMEVGKGGECCGTASVNAKLQKLDI